MFLQASIYFKLCTLDFIYLYSSPATIWLFLSYEVIVYIIEIKAKLHLILECLPHCRMSSNFWRKKLVDSKASRYFANGLPS